MERSTGVKPVSSVWKTEAQSLRQPRVVKEHDPSPDLPAFYRSVPLPSARSILTGDGSLATAGGVEPPALRFGNGSSTTASRPPSGVSDGLRSRCLQGHNLALCRVSYTHRI